MLVEEVCVAAVESAVGGGWPRSLRIAHRGCENTGAAGGLVGGRVEP